MHLQVNDNIYLKAEVARGAPVQVGRDLGGPVVSMGAPAAPLRGRRGGWSMLSSEA